MTRSAMNGRAMAPIAALPAQGEWPTPTSGASRTGGLRAFDGGKYARSILERRVGREESLLMQRRANPEWVEWLMGFPIGWTA